MSIGWIKDKFGRRAYAYSHEKAVLCGADADKTLEDRLKDFLPKTGAAADANKLGGQAPDFYAKREDLDSYLPKDSAAADANKLGGQAPGYYAKNADLANFLPLSGGNVATLTVGGQVALHKGNSAPVAVQASAPSDTSAVRIW